MGDRRRVGAVLRTGGVRLAVIKNAEAEERRSAFNIYCAPLLSWDNDIRGDRAKLETLLLRRFIILLNTRGRRS